MLAGSMFHLFIIKVHMANSALSHSAHFPLALYHFMNEKKAGFMHLGILLLLLLLLLLLQISCLLQ